MMGSSGQAKADSILVAWVAAGLLWLMVGLPWVPSGKIYHQGLVLLLWLPALLLCISFRQDLKRFFGNAPLGVWVLVAFVAWAVLSLMWSEAANPPREAKRILYVVLFLLSMALLGMRRNADRLVDGLWWVALALALAVAGAASILNFYVIQGNPWPQRMLSLGRFEHPVLGGFAFAAGFGILATFSPVGMLRRIAWALGLLALLCAVALTQTRGAALTIVAFMAVFGLWAHNKRIAWAGAALIAVGAIFAYVYFEHYLTTRGYSYRPQIMLASLDLILSNPLHGLGVGSPYSFGKAEGFPSTIVHSHSLILHVGIELGLIGMVLWLGVLVSMIGTAWRQRATPLAQVILTLTFMAIVASVFDIGRMWETPRVEWLMEWVPVGLWLNLIGRSIAAGVDRT